MSADRRRVAQPKRLDSADLFSLANRSIIGPGSLLSSGQARVETRSRVTG